METKALALGSSKRGTSTKVAWRTQSARYGAPVSGQLEGVAPWDKRYALLR